MTEILDIVAESCSAFPDSICCVSENPNGRDVFLSYSSMWRCLDHHECWLNSIVNSFSEDTLSSDDIVVAYLSSNSIDMLLSLLACTSSFSRKKIPALLNFRWTALEMAAVLKSKGRNAITIVLYGPGFESTGKQVSSQLGHKSCCLPLPDFSSKYLHNRQPLEVANQKCDRFDHREKIDQVRSSGSDNVSLIIFTSGTTGGSKGVRLSHRAVSIQSLAKISYPCEYSVNTTMLASTVPIFHIGGLSSCLSVLFSGGKLFFPYSKSGVGFDTNLVRRSLMNPCIAVNTLVVVPTMLVSILADTSSPDVYLKVRLLLIGGQSATPSVISKIRRKFPNARIVQTYACTEAASSLTFLNIDSTFLSASKGNTSKHLSGDSVGSPPQHIEIRLYKKSGKATKIVTLPNQVGVIATRGSHVMNGYWNRGGKNININGWLITSDLGYWLPTGELCFSGRLKDVIRSGGETVLANEVERVILKHPDVSECAVFPLKDERFGETVACAIIVERPLQLVAIRAWCGDQGLASYKRPRYLFLVDKLPRNSSGKVLKHKLVAIYGRNPTSRL